MSVLAGAHSTVDGPLIIFLALNSRYGNTTCSSMRTTSTRTRRYGESP